MSGFEEQSMSDESFAEEYDSDAEVRNEISVYFPVRLLAVLKLCLFSSPPSCKKHTLVANLSLV